MSFSTFVVDTTTPGSEVRYPVSLCRSLGLLRGPLDANVWVRGGQRTGDRLPLDRGGTLTFSEGVEVVYISWDQTATGAQLVFIASAEIGGAAAVVNTASFSVSAQDGDILAIGATTESPATDPYATGTVVGLLKGLLAAMQGDVAPPGNPDIASITCVAADPTTYDHDVAAVLGRHAHQGTLRSDPDNAGTVSWAVSSDGATWSGWYPLEIGEGYDLSGLDVHSVRVKSSHAGDIVHLEAH